MHPFTAAVVDRLNRSRADLLAAIDAVPSDARGRRPAPDRWSINEIVEHLSIVEALFTRRIADAIAAAKQNGLGEEQASTREPLPLNIERVVADRTNPRSAPDAAHPRGGLDDAAAVAAAQRSREAFVATLLDVDGLALSGVFAEHPFFGRLTIYQVAELIAAHEARHTQQIGEAAARAGM